MEAINLKKLRRNLFSLPSEGNVKRSLFGEVDHEEVKKDLEREFRETLHEKSKLWNFDFEKYCPRNEEETTGLQWTTCPCPVTETSITEERNLVTSFNTAFTTTNTYTSNVHEKPNEQELRKTPVRNRTNSVLNSDDDSPAIQIINESPIRSLTPPEHPTSIEKSSVKLDITSTLTRGKRKRSFQPTIDDFMKKKKPRVNMEFNALKKTTTPVSSRLRSSPSKVQVKV